MSMATRLANCLARKQSRFDIVRHPHATGGLASTEVTHVPGDRMARTVLLEDSKGYLTAVIPSTHHLKLSEIREQTGRKLSLAHGAGLREVFKDCDPEAIPPAGFGTQTWLDDSLLTHADVYFETGDHQELVHMSVEQFAELMADARRGHFSHRVM
nr:YbaK/EbsC family protein [uncultured Cupriavidus sp.]